MIKYIIYLRRKEEREGLIMCDVKKYNEIFQEIKSLRQDDTLQLILEAKTQEEREFYVMVGNFLLQKKQKLVVEGNLF